MNIEEMTNHIRGHFDFDPTVEQERAMNVFAMFLLHREGQSGMILRGSAGTGKTSLAGAIVRTMKSLGQKVMLLAPTGRAAKVFSLNSGHPASTIHRKIYRQKTFAGDRSVFSLNDNLSTDTLFVVDEASMIANAGQGNSPFGTGRLLDDLVQFVYTGRNCRMLLIGDKAQLPPVGEEESPALTRGEMAAYGLYVFESDLSEVLRQSIESGILYNATLIRRMITHEAVTLLPKIQFRDFPDIRIVPGNELIEQLNSSYSEVGFDETMVVTRSNKRANVYNAGIRNSILDCEEELNRGDLLMVVKNNYYWGEKTEQSQLSFIANGDRARVLKVRNVRQLYGFRFADTWLQFPDYGDEELQATVLLDSLHTEAPALTVEQGDRLFHAVMEDYADIPRKPDRIKRIKEDPHFNAIQIKYAYAVTCHKAQGGQWAHIYLDQGYMTDAMVTPDYIHWLYTAFTRATEKLFLVNWPKTQVEET